MKSFSQKIKIAFIKFGGLSAGGTEKFLQTIAANLPKNKFDVDYFYCDTAPYSGSEYKHPGTDKNKVRYMLERGVNLIKFNVGYKNILTLTHDWVDTDFWEKFNETNYDIIQTARAGHPEYPFYKIKHTSIVDSLHLSGMVDNQYNISRVMHICKWNADKWIEKGGDGSRVVIVSHPMEINYQDENFRSEMQLNGKFIFGFHQRNDDMIFSPMPLAAYSKIETKDTMFLLLGGGEKYREQAKNLGIKSIVFLEHTGNSQIVYKFLSTLDVYAHGRKDGEVNSTAMAEAMYFGLPLVSHFSEVNNGHVECIENAGKVVSNNDEYAQELVKLQNDKEYYRYRSQEAKKRFAEKYELQGQMKNIINIYEDVIKNPFPNKIRRCYYHCLNFIVKRVLVNKYTYSTLRKIQKLIK